MISSMVNGIRKLKGENLEFYGTSKEIVESYGRKFDKYNVDTADGYILEVHNIRAPDMKADAPVVFL